MTKELATRKEEQFNLLEGDNLRGALQKIRQFQGIVKKLLVKDTDYGVIPGTGDKPTLLKPGAEKIAKMHGLADTYQTIESVEDFDKPFFKYTIKCILTHVASGNVVSEGMGSCNSYESKYRYRWVPENKIPHDLDIKDLPSKSTQFGIRYRIENDDIFSQANTLLKMAKKRAMVDATLSACRLSSVFTQDFDDIEDAQHVVQPAPGKKPPVQQPQSKSQQGQKQESKKVAEEPLSVEEALKVAVGQGFDVTGMITDIGEREVTKKNKTKDFVTDYSIAHDTSTIIVSAWGKKDKRDIKLDDIVIAQDVTVIEWRGEKKYTAKDIVLAGSNEEMTF